jgi:hypothetical protein
MAAVTPVESAPSEPVAPQSTRVAAPSMSLRVDTGLPLVHADGPIDLYGATPWLSFRYLGQEAHARARISLTVARLDTLYLG